MIHITVLDQINDFEPCGVNAERLNCSAEGHTCTYDTMRSSEVEEIVLSVPADAIP